MIVTLIGYFGLLFLTTKFRDSALGLALSLLLPASWATPWGRLLATIWVCPTAARS